MITLYTTVVIISKRYLLSSNSFCDHTAPQILQYQKYIYPSPK